MCFYQPNKPPCTCSYCQLVHPCNQASFYHASSLPSSLPFPVAVPLLPLPSPAPADKENINGGSSGDCLKGHGTIIAPCSNVYITYEAGERHCLRCRRILYEGRNMDMDMDLDDDVDEIWNEDIFDDYVEHLCPLFVATPAAPKTGMTIRSTKPKRYFKRESLSMPVMYLRWKWKETVARSFSLSSLSVKSESEPGYKLETGTVPEPECCSAQDASSSGDELGAGIEAAGLGLCGSLSETSSGGGGDAGVGRGSPSRFYRDVQFGKK